MDKIRIAQKPHSDPLGSQKIRRPIGTRLILFDRAWICRFPTQLVVGTPLELPTFGHRRHQVQRDRFQVHLSMIPCPRIEYFSRNIESEAKPVRQCCPVNRSIATVVCVWIRDDNTEPGIGAGTPRLLPALFLGPHPSRPSSGVRPDQLFLDRRFGQLVVPGGRREDPRFRLFALTDWPAIHRAECCLVIFP